MNFFCGTKQPWGIIEECEIAVECKEGKDHE